MAAPRANRETSVSIEVFGEREVSRTMLRKGDRVDDATPAFSKISRMLTARTRKHWRSDGARGGARWEPLKDSTIASKRSNPKRRGKPEAILRLSYLLWHSLTRDKARGAIRVVKKLELHWGSRVDYGKYHHSRRPRTSNLPRRAVVAFTDKDKKDVMKVLQRWVRTGAV